MNYFRVLLDFLILNVAICSFSNGVDFTNSDSSMMLLLFVFFLNVYLNKSYSVRVGLFYSAGALLLKEIFFFLEQGC